MMMNNKIAVFDIDDTLSDQDHRKHWITGKPKNWKAYFESMTRDSVIFPVAELMKKMSGIFTVVLCTGRPEEYRTITQDWMKTHGLDSYYKKLYMRPLRDYREDTVVKLEMLDKIKQDFDDYPQIWFDDRLHIIEAIAEHSVMTVHIDKTKFL